MAFVFSPHACRKVWPWSNDPIVEVRQGSPVRGAVGLGVASPVVPGGARLANVGLGEPVDPVARVRVVRRVRGLRLAVVRVARVLARVMVGNRATRGDLVPTLIAHREDHEFPRVLIQRILTRQ